MDWYKSYQLVKDGEGYTLEIRLNPQASEFSKDIDSSFKENLLNLDDQIKELVKERFGDIKINTIKLLLGTLTVATIPFIGPFAMSAKASTYPTSTQTTTTTASTAITLNTTGVVTASQLNVRQGPSTSYAIIHRLWLGNVVKVTGSVGSWYRIQLSDGRTGWVSGAYLRVNDREQAIDKVVQTAKSLLGTPYVWGGESLSEGGFDCSGFTQYVYKQVGYSLNRISSDQAKQGTYVARTELQRGDLVFYSFQANGIIDHVGIYIGDGQMIHSPKAGDTVKTTYIGTSYWQTRFVTARRIIP